MFIKSSRPTEFTVYVGVMSPMLYAPFIRANFSCRLETIRTSETNLELALPPMEIPHALRFSRMNIVSQIFSHRFRSGGSPHMAFARQSGNVSRTASQAQGKVSSCVSVLGKFSLHGSSAWMPLSVRTLLGNFPT